MSNCGLEWFLGGMLAAGAAWAQRTEPMPQIEPQVLARGVSDGRVTVVHLAPRYATAIRMHEAVSAVVVGDPASFSAEHSDQEPNLVFVKPITSKPAQTNLLISTTHGHQASLLLISRGEMRGEQAPEVDFVLRYKPAGRFLIEPADYSGALVAETAKVAGAQDSTIRPVSTAVPAQIRRRFHSRKTTRGLRSTICLSGNGRPNCRNSTVTNRGCRMRVRNWSRLGSAKSSIRAVRWWCFSR